MRHCFSTRAPAGKAWALAALAFAFAPSAGAQADPSAPPNAPEAAAEESGPPVPPPRESPPAPAATPTQPPSAPPAADGGTVPAPRAHALPPPRPTTAPGAPATPAATPAPPDREPFEGFRVRSPGGDHELKLGALVQADGRFFLAGAGTDTFVARRARLDVKATVARYFRVRLHPEFAGSTPSLLDAYGTVAFLDELQLQAGKMKSPLGLELLQSPGAMVFPERGLPSLLVPNRDAGVVLQGELFAGAVTYAAGVFNGVPDGASGIEDENDAKEGEGRVFVRPFAPLGVEAIGGLGVGFAGSYGVQAGALPTYRTPGRQTFFAYLDTDTVAATADGRQVRLSPQGYYYYGPVGVLAEYVRRAHHVSDGATTTELSATAWQVWGSFVLGGRADYRGAKVKAPLDPRRGTWGAVEAALRYGELAFDREAFDVGVADPNVSARAAHDFGVAVSWWWLDTTRALLAYDRTEFTGGASDGDRDTEHVLVARLQVGL